MSYFAAALVALLAAESLMVAGWGFPNAPIRAPATLLLVHLVVLGWLSLLLCGALFQFVPVLIARPLHSATLPLPALVLLLGGLAALLTGFLGLDGTVAVALPFFPVASVLLAAGFSLVLWNLGRTLWAARPLGLPARFVAVGLLGLAATVAIGITFALVLAGDTTTPAALRLFAYGLPIHIVAGLGGWLTLTAMGVSYRLLAMFMLAPELDRPSTRAVLRFGAWALGVAVLGGTAAVLANHGTAPVFVAAGVLGLLTVILYARDIAHLYRARKRRVIELNGRMAAAAVGSLLLAALLIVVLGSMGALARHAGAVVFLIVFGWLSGLGLAKLYKIVPFLTWLECYGPVLGKAPTPRVQDLVAEQHARKWFGLYFIAAWAATVALFLESAWAFRVAAALLLIGTAGIVLQLVRARRLDDVPASARFPAGSMRPPLILSLTRSH
ncbi:MAG: hypothetical protein ACYCZD_14935 [Rhodanobacter sp.]